MFHSLPVAFMIGREKSNNNINKQLWCILIMIIIISILFVHSMCLDIVDTFLVTLIIREWLMINYRICGIIGNTNLNIFYFFYFMQPLLQSSVLYSPLQILLIWNHEIMKSFCAQEIVLISQCWKQLLLNNLGGRLFHDYLMNKRTAFKKETTVC